jgi:hypothetical protein
MLKAEVKKVVDEKRDELKERLVNKLLGSGESTGDGEETATDDEQEEEDLEDRLKRLFDN